MEIIDIKLTAFKNIMCKYQKYKITLTITSLRWYGCNYLENIQ
jgi:hypothetical protein